MTQKRKSHTTSASISFETAKELNEICTRLGCTKDEFIKSSVAYFQSNEIDPRFVNEIAPDAVSRIEGKIDKRINQVIAFIKTSEDKILEPMAKENKELNANIKMLLTLIQNSKR